MYLVKEECHKAVTNKAGNLRSPHMTRIRRA